MPRSAANIASIRSKRSDSCIWLAFSRLISFNNQHHKPHMKTSKTRKPALLSRRLSKTSRTDEPPIKKHLKLLLEAAKDLQRETHR